MARAFEALHMHAKIKSSRPWGAPTVCSSFLCGGMVRYVLADETFDEIITVVVAGLQAQLQWMSCCSAGRLQQFRLQLRGEELIRIALVDQ